MEFGRARFGWSLAALALGLLAGAGCATGARPAAPKGSALTVQSPPRSAATATPTVYASDRPLELRIDPGSQGNLPVRQAIDIDHRLVPSELTTLRARLDDLPVEFRLKRVERERWMIEIPENVVQLLAKTGHDASYSGLVSLDEQGRNLVMRLVFEGAGTSGVEARKRQQAERSRPAPPSPARMSAG